MANGERMIIETKMVKNPRGKGEFCELFIADNDDKAMTVRYHDKKITYYFLRGAACHGTLEVNWKGRDRFFGSKVFDFV